MNTERTCGQCLHLSRKPDHEGGICTYNADPIQIDGFVSGEVRWIFEPACDHPMYGSKREELRLAMEQATTRDLVCPFCKCQQCKCETEG